MVPREADRGGGEGIGRERGGGCGRDQSPIGADRRRDEREVRSTRRLDPDGGRGCPKTQRHGGATLHVGQVERDGIERVRGGHRHRHAYGASGSWSSPAVSARLWTTLNAWIA